MEISSIIRNISRFNKNVYLDKELCKYLSINKGQVSDDLIDKFLVKHKIIFDFNNNVKGKSFDSNCIQHCGSEGHWLEQQFGVKPNGYNAPDRDGIEIKKQSSKITFGDWSASWYLYEDKKYKMTRNNFIRTFGSKKRKNRYSWSGEVFPKYGMEYNYSGQRIRFSENEDLVIEYSFSNDMRERKRKFKEDPIIIAIWKKSKLENHIIKKFGVKGFAICKKNEKNIYDKICFGNPLDFKFFRSEFEKKNIILDSGMYEGNTRQYSKFRANKNLWDTLITEEY